MADKEPFIHKIHGTPDFDGSAARELKARKSRSVKKGIHTAERLVSEGGGSVFNYSLFEGEWKELIDWLFLEDLPYNLEHKGITVTEVTSILASGHFPTGMNAEKLIIWIQELKNLVENGES
ncbi:MAG: hypothetical protein UY13_C0002G0236 [Candidatus Pacebacteria bacterium GW2011_GWB1_47_8]|nr:MAG: hypothetical protein UX28_C0001G0384 [Candidatus Pacebacteria bacterium GW2011_GWA1_46_10]KKU84324.1 MAG: hypothetical protein UY13_C0002G0236 [Candidatus Pacebacteria bacterium GW2011_GWB1_47_8]HCR81251.1 hypothetical protein [Candidatus Paceibacterota bacterium]